jgi:hypothetical protein
MMDRSRTGRGSLQVFSRNGIVNGFSPAADRPLDHHLRVVSARIRSISFSPAVFPIDVVAVDPRCRDC